MDFVDEQDRPAAHAAGALGVGHHGLDFLDSGEHGAERHKIGFGQARDQAREGGFSHTGRAPQNQGGQLIPLDLRAQRLSRAQDMLLPDEILEFFGTHSLGQRALGIVRVRERSRLEQAHFVTRISDTAKPASFLTPGSPAVCVPATM